MTAQEKGEVWLIRMAEIFADQAPQIMTGLDAQLIRKLGRDFYLIRIKQADAITHSSFARYIRWNMPVHHSWPCNPRETDGFIEKAAQALLRKFRESEAQTLICGQIDPGSPKRYDRSLASNLRGRALQLFTREWSTIKNAEEQDPNQASLFCLVGKEGLYAGLQSPARCDGFFPGGTKFISQNSPDTISRAGAKIAEALHHLQLTRRPPPKGSRWLELGASPGGMTTELLARDYDVIAVDRAPLDARLKHAKGLVQFVADAADFMPPAGMIFDAILCDMNGDARDAMRQVARLSKNLQPKGIVIFTLKLPGISTIQETDELEMAVTQSAKVAGLHKIATRHLTYNRNEFTMFFERES
ncbi:MAG: SAM-dependent methyltransferase [Luteolibacter sp.]